MIQGTYYKEWSRMLGRDMEFKVYGHAGTPVLALPARGGRFYDWENNGMPDAIAPLLNEGKVQLFCADSIDAESLLAGNTAPRRRAEMQEKYFNYLTSELAPRILALNGAKKDTLLWAVGVDTGAYQAVNACAAPRCSRVPSAFPACTMCAVSWAMQQMTWSCAMLPWPIWQRRALWTRSCWQRLRRMPFSSVPVRAATRATHWWTPRPWPMH